MIKLDNGYCIDIDSRNYTVKREGGINKEGIQNYIYLGYYSKLESAIQSIIEDRTKRALCKGVYDLKETVSIIQDIHSKTDSLLEQALNYTKERQR